MDGAKGVFEVDSEVEVKKRKKLSKFYYNFGTKYPGVSIGHKGCYPFEPILPYNVPFNMGWLWNAEHQYGKIRHSSSVMTDTKNSDGLQKPCPQRPPGWRPGAIGKSMLRVMTLRFPGFNDGGKKSFGKGATPFTGVLSLEGSRTGSPSGDSSRGAPSEVGLLDPKPTLRIKRKGDEYTIEVNPLKDITTIAPNEDPYVDCDPLIIKLIKKRSPEELIKYEAKKLAKERKRRDEEIRAALRDAAEDICKCAYTDVYCNNYKGIDVIIEKCPNFEEPECICKEESMSSMSSNASWDIEYTPPFGCYDLSPRKPKTYGHVESQYNPKDCPTEESNKKKAKKKRSKSSLGSKKSRSSKKSSASKKSKGSKKKK